MTTKALLEKLGITYDQSHAVLAYLVFIVSYIISGLMFSSAEYLIATLFTLSLQSTNEAIQAIDSNLIKKYKSLKNFQKNSRNDWFWFSWGLGGAIVTIILFNITF